MVCKNRPQILAEKISVLVSHAKPICGSIRAISIFFEFHFHFQGVTWRLKIACAQPEYGSKLWVNTKAVKNGWFHSGSIVKHKSPHTSTTSVGPQNGPPFPTVAVFIAGGDDFGVGKPRVQLGVQYEGKVNVLGKLLGRKFRKQFCLFVYTSPE